MPEAAETPSRDLARTVPIEVLWVLGSSLAMLVVVWLGSEIAARLPQNAWMFLIAYAAPGSLAFGAFWLICRRLRP